MTAPTSFSPDTPPPRRRPQPPRSRMSLNITAMIDVVFLLLIYFLAVTNFKLHEEVYRLDLPQRGQAQQVDPFELDQEPLRISINSSGETYRLYIDGPYAQPVTFAELHEFLLQRQIGPQTSGGLFAPDHPIVLDPHEDARWEHVIGAFNAAVRAEYTNVTFAGRPS